MEERISELEVRNLEMIQVEEEREVRFFNKETLQELSNLIRKGNIRIMGIPEWEKSLFKETTAENFPNLGRNWIYKSTKLIEHPIISMQKDLLEDT